MRKWYFTDTKIEINRCKGINNVQGRRVPGSETLKFRIHIQAMLAVMQHIFMLQKNGS